MLFAHIYIYVVRQRYVFQIWGKCCMVCFMGLSFNVPKYIIFTSWWVEFVMDSYMCVYFSFDSKRMVEGFL